MTAQIIPAPALAEVEHTQVDYARDRYAGHPRQGGIFNFGGGEIAIIYNRAPCAYRNWSDVKHDLGGYHSRAQIILARSFDNGASWNRDKDVVIFDESAPVEERRAFVQQVQANPAIVRSWIDLTAPETAIYFGTHLRRRGASAGHALFRRALAGSRPNLGSSPDTGPAAGRAWYGP